MYSNTLYHVTVISVVNCQHRVGVMLLDTEEIPIVHCNIALFGVLCNIMCISVTACIGFSDLNFVLNVHILMYWF